VAILFVAIGWVGCVGYVGYIGWDKYFRSDGSDGSDESGISDGSDGSDKPAKNPGRGGPIKSELRDYVSKTSDSQTLTIIAQAFTYAGDSEFAIEILNRIDTNEAKAEALRAVADSHVRIGDKQKASALLSEAAQAVRRTSDVDKILGDVSYRKAESFTKIAESYAKIGAGENASALLSDAIRIIEQAGGRANKAQTLKAIASAAGNLVEKDKAKNLLLQVINAADKIPDNLARF
jgi:tetratricopeptide (TPR) repeat protein